MSNIFISSSRKPWNTAVSTTVFTNDAVPADIQTGDLLISVFQLNASVATSVTFTAGYKEFINNFQFNNSNVIKTVAIWGYYDGVTLPSFTTNAGDTGDAMINNLVWRGTFDPLCPIGQVSREKAMTTTTFVAPSVGTTIPGSYLVNIFGSKTASNALQGNNLGQPTDMTMINKSVTRSVTLGLLSAMSYEYVAKPSATGTRTWSNLATNSTGSGWSFVISPPNNAFGQSTLAGSNAITTSSYSKTIMSYGRSFTMTSNAWFTGFRVAATYWGLNNLQELYVGLYDITGGKSTATLVASATMEMHSHSATAQWLTTAITPVSLVSGKTYAYAWVPKTTSGLYTLQAQTTSSVAEINNAATASTMGASWSGTVVATDTDLVMQGLFLDRITVNSVNGSNTVAVGSAGNTVSTTGLTGATTMSVGGKRVSNITGSNDSWVFDAPSMVDGQTFPAYGNQEFYISNGTKAGVINVTLNPPTTANGVTITDVSGTGPGYIQSYNTVAVNDVVTIDKPTKYGVTTNQITANGLIQVDYLGTQYLWLRTTSTGVITRISLVTGVDNLIDTLSFTSKTNKPMNSVHESNVQTISGIDTGLNLPLSITGGMYALNTGGGFGAFTNAGTTVKVGDTIKLQGIAPATYGGTTTVTVTVGTLPFTYTVTSSVKGVINLVDWVANTTSLPIFDGANINGGH